MRCKDYDYYKYKIPRSSSKRYRGFPHMIVPLFVGREKSIKALEDVMNDDKQIL